MFNSLFKTLLLRYGRNHTVRAASSTCNKFRHFHFQTSILVKKNVSTTTSIPHSITISHLMISSGLSPESAFGVSKFSTYPESQENPVTAYDFFAKHGFTDDQIFEVMDANPRAHTLKPEETLLPKFEFLYSRGFSGLEIGQIFCGYPSLFDISLEKHVIPTFKFLDDLFKSRETNNIIKCRPLLLCDRLGLAPNVKALRDTGVSESNIHLFFQKWPSMIEKGYYLRSAVQEIKRMGINPSSSLFLEALFVRLYAWMNWEDKFSCYISWGLSEEEIIAAFVKYTKFMKVSMNKIDEVMEFLVNKLRLEPSAIVKCPEVVGLSVENNFVPRVAVIKFLRSNRLIKYEKNSDIDFLTIFQYPEETFLEKFVNRFDEAPQILQLCKEKSELYKEEMEEKKFQLEKKKGKLKEKAAGHARKKRETYRSFKYQVLLLIICKQCSICEELYRSQVSIYILSLIQPQLVIFNFLCKTFLLRYGKNHTVRAASSTCKFQHFQTSILVKYVSTTTSRPESIIVSYLINSCGLSPESALAASKSVNSGSQKNPDLVISFFRSHGFSEAQISKVIRRNPRVLWTRLEETLLPKFEFLYSRGFSGSEIGYIFHVYPPLLHRSLENHIIPIFNYLDDLFKSSCETVVAAIKRNPVLLHHDVKTCMAPNVNVLRENGVPESNIHLFLRYWSRMFGTRPDTFRNTVKVVKEMGINPLTSHFVQAVYVRGCGNAKWDSKVSVYKRWGWSEEEVLAAFVKYPMFMTASENKIMAVMDFLVNKMHFESSAIAKRPDVIVLSLEKTFVPRAAVIQFLMSNGLIKKKQNANLFTVIKYTEKNFLQRFVNCYDEAPQLLKLYQEKLELSKTKKK